MKRMVNYWIEITLHLLFWGLFFYAINSLTRFTVKYLDNFAGNGERILSASLYPLTFIFYFFLVFLFYVNSLWLLSRKLVKVKRLKILASVFFATVLYVINYYSIKHFISLSTLSIDQWNTLQRNILLIFAFVWGISLSYYFAKDRLKNEIIRKQMESNQLATELSFLKSQINPHFLFNTLNNLFSLAQEKQNEELANGISRLSEMMRYMIYESNVEKVTLEKEIIYLKSFIALHKLRFSDHEINMNFSYPENCKGVMVTPMLFIPFVENAFKYGIRVNESSSIKIAIEIPGNEIKFFCENNDYSAANKTGNTVQGIGLSNVKRRLELTYPALHSLEIKKSDNKYSVLLRLQI